MADSKQTIIIKKVKGGGHGGAHGGAWKVAFADFMTAMMTFFLVMWLLGSDEEIKSSVAEYFNNPASAWRPDLSSKETVPLGERTGAGDNLLKGLEGLAPEELIERPSRQFKASQDPPAERHNEEGIYPKQGLKPPVKMEIDILRFTIPEHQLFKGGSDELTPDAEKYLANLTGVLKGYGGRLEIKGFTVPAPTAEAVITDAYEFSMTRTVAVLKHLVAKRVIDENRVSTKVSDAGRTIASDDTPGTRRIEFTLTRE